MIIFTVPKPFKGEFDIIQNNAIDSWLMISPKPKIVLMGDEEGVSEIVRQKGLIHIKEIKKNKYGTPLLNDIFEKIQKEYKDEMFLYINTDIVLLDFPTDLMKTILNKFDKFLAIGKRYEMEIKSRMNGIEIKKKAKLSEIQQKSSSWMDYFVFTSKVFEKIPPFALGRTFWDKWLVWDTIQKKIPVVDITNQLFAIHQSHSYAMNKKTNLKNVWAGEQALGNLKLAGGWSCGANVDNANYIVLNKKICFQKSKKSKRFVLDMVPFLWPFFLRLRLLREKYSLKWNKKNNNCV
ncbi:hypothetical protein SDC9_91666 [bioreactor metagenome]|uniref:Glycosyltransferase 2-like domain-containing protein n=1 Tax=bioreactor metagenome TaxID=1076179 RepID=A0A644ZYF8_9ZZZZ